jgi:hypothetical protein
LIAVFLGCLKYALEEVRSAKTLFRISAAFFLSAKVLSVGEAVAFKASA